MEEINAYTVQAPVLLLLCLQYHENTATWNMFDKTLQKEAYYKSLDLFEFQINA